MSLATLLAETLEAAVKVQLRSNEMISTQPASLQYQKK
jgi:hypothetical protein